MAGHLDWFFHSPYKWFWACPGDLLLHSSKKKTSLESSLIEKSSTYIPGIVGPFYILLYGKEHQLMFCSKSTECPGTGRDSCLAIVQFIAEMSWHFTQFIFGSDSPQSRGVTAFIPSIVGLT